jgi:hypothetical protein
MSTSGSKLRASEAVPAPRRPTVARAVIERNLCPRVRVRSRPSSLTGVTMRQRRHPARVHQRGDRVDVRESIEREAIWRSDDARPAMARGSTSSGGCPNAPSGARTFKTECETRVYEVVDRDEDGMRQGRRSTRRPDHVGDRIKGMDGVTPRSEPQGSTRIRRQRALAHRTPLRQLAHWPDRPPVDSSLGQRDGSVGFEPTHGAVGALRADDDTRLCDRGRPVAVAQPVCPDEVPTASPDVTHLTHDIRSRGLGRNMPRAR